MLSVFYIGMVLIHGNIYIIITKYFWHNRYFYGIYKQSVIGDRLRYRDIESFNIIILCSVFCPLIWINQVSYKSSRSIKTTSWVSQQKVLIRKLYDINYSTHLSIALRISLFYRYTAYTATYIISMHIFLHERMCLCSGRKVCEYTTSVGRVR